MVSQMSDKSTASSTSKRKTFDSGAGLLQTWLQKPAAKRAKHAAGGSAEAGNESDTKSQPASIQSDPQPAQRFQTTQQAPVSAGTN